MAPRGKNPDADDPFTEDDWGPSEGTTQAESDEIATPQIDPNRLPWIKPINVLPKREGTLELVSYGGPSARSDVTLVVKHNGKQFHLGLQAYDKGYIALAKKFGTKKGDWHGPIRYKVMPWKGNPDGFIAVRP